MADGDRGEVGGCRSRPEAVGGAAAELNAYELSRFDGADLDRTGEYGYPYLDAYWIEPERHPFVIEVDGRIAGLVLVRTGPPRSIAELLVLPRFRRGGVGTVAAREAFSPFAGDWEVHELAGNDDAVAFWRRAIPVPFDEIVTPEGTTQRFTVAGR